MWEAGEMTQLLRVLAALPKDPSLVPSTNVKQLTTTCDCSSRKFNSLLWLPQADTDTQSACVCVCA